MFRSVALSLVLLAAAAQAAGQGQLCAAFSAAAAGPAQMPDDKSQDQAFSISVDGIRLPPDDGALAFAPLRQVQAECPATS